MATIARSLAEAFSLRTSLTTLLLQKSPDLVCNNIMCEKVTLGCACKLALSLGRLQRLQCLDISQNQLTVLPDSLWHSHLVDTLEELDISKNKLRAIPVEISGLAHLQSLDIRFNALDASGIPWRSIAEMRSLRRLRVFEGNHPSCEAAADELRSRCPDLEIL